MAVLMCKTSSNLQERPRNRVALADSAEYNHYRAEVLKFLYERQLKPESGDGSSKKDDLQETAEDKPLQVVASICRRLRAAPASQPQPALQGRS